MATAKKKIIDLDLEFKTTDLYLAAFFIANQQRLLRSERVGPRVTFYFDKEAAALRSGWIDSSATVNAQAYTTALKNLKQLVSTNEG